MPVEKSLQLKLKLSVGKPAVPLYWMVGVAGIRASSDITASRAPPKPVGPMKLLIQSTMPGKSALLSVLLCCGKRVEVYGFMKNSIPSLPPLPSIFVERGS